MKLNKIYSLLLICFLTLGYIFIPFSYDVYADSVPSGYTQATSRQELIDAFLAYCKSRDSEITSSLLGASSTFAYEVLKNTSETVGFDLDTVQSQLWYQYQNNGGLRWYMSSIGVTFFNYAFGYLIQERGLEPGDSADLTVDSGIYYTTRENYTAKLYIFDYPNPYFNVGTNNHVTSNGTDYKYPYQTFDVFNAQGDFDVLENNKSIEFQCGSVADSGIQLGGYGYVLNHKVVFSEKSNDGISSNLATAYASEGDTEAGFNHLHVILYRLSNSSSNTVYIGAYNEAHVATSVDPYGNWTSKYQLRRLGTLPNEEPLSEVNVYFISNKISNEYEGDTIINNEGDIINNSNPSEPSNPSDPSDNWDPSENPNLPTSPTPQTPNITNWPTIDLPDFDIPDGFSLGDLREKFPFSIPFDLVALLTVLDAEPIAPRIQADIPISVGLVDYSYTWHLDFDFNTNDWNNIASTIRIIEFIGFCLGLIYFTVKVVKG